MALFLAYTPVTEEGPLSRPEAFAAEGVYGSGTDNPVLVIERDEDSGDLEARRVTGPAGANGQYPLAVATANDFGEGVRFRRLSDDANDNWEVVHRH